tara:strand:+ start:612 stop:860 length:249 start_codon:yes stop_codon:yes gene_type:complete
MYKIENILNGWQNFMSKSEVTEALAKERAKICSGCDSNVKSKLLIFVKDELKEIEGHKCKECQCPLSAKIRSVNEKCDLDKW